LAALIAAAMPAPKRRVATKPTFASKQRRLEGKKQRSQIKRGRGARGMDDA
jgi:ribosome-associated protein